MRHLFASACLSPIVLALLASPAAAATDTISTALTTPVATSTAVSGAPGDISITSDGSIKPTSGTAITIDSANSVTNAGTIDIENADNAIGILANAGESGSITNSGTITVSESYTQTDTNGDGIVDGPFAEGSGRYGISTAGAFTGDITNSGTITVHGNNSAGIALGGPLTGTLTSSGTITVVGDNSAGITSGAVSGDVLLSGTVSATGQNSAAVVLGGDIGGTVNVQGTLTSTGYTSTAAPTDTSTLGADNLLQGGSALSIGGSVAGGVVLSAASSTTDSSGNTVTTTAATISSVGSAPALLIGSAANAITLGAVTSDTAGHGLVIGGTVAGSGVYTGVTAIGAQIGGLGGAVTIDGGISVTGSLGATAVGATANGLDIGSGATVPAIDVSGSIEATGGTSSDATALQIDAGATGAAITNSGTISASGGGVVTAITDASGTVTSLTNSGTISAADGTSNVAVNLAAAAGDVTITNTAGTITGDILLGAGDDSVTSAGGTITGDTSFGAGANTLALSGAATYVGNVTFGAGADSMTLADTSTFTGAADFSGGADGLTIGGTGSFNGTLANAGALAVQVTGGTLNVTSTGAVAIGSLAVTGNGTLGVTIDPGNGLATDYQVAGAATFDTGSKIAVHISTLGSAVGSYQVVTAGTLTGGENLTSSDVSLPYLFKSSVAADDAAGTVDLTVARKTAAELGLNRSESSAYDAIYAAASGDTQIGDSLLSIDDQATLRHSFQQMLPDHAGGAFATVTEGSRATARMLADPDAPIVDAGRFGFWLQQVGWEHTKSLGDTSGYHVDGFGVSGGAEIGVGVLGHLGVSVAYLAGKDDDASNANSVNSDQYEAAAYWRADWGHVHAFARGSYALVDFGSRREFTGVADGVDVTRVAQGSWKGHLYSGSGGLSYRAQIGAFSLRPQVSIDYYHLAEGGYAETGGGSGFDLIVDGRTSDEFAATGALALGYDIFRDTADSDGGYLRAEIEGGRRQIVGGQLGDTTAHFTGGDDFTLTPDDEASGWTGAVRLKGGSGRYTLTAEIDADQQTQVNDNAALALRAGFQVGF